MTALSWSLLTLAIIALIFTLRLPAWGRRWHVIYPNGVCSPGMLYRDALNLAIKFRGRVAKS